MPPAIAPDHERGPVRRDRWAAVDARFVAALATLVMAALLAGVPPAAAATTLRVPEDYATISSAVLAASSGDVIDVGPGVYHEAVTLTKRVTLEGRVFDPANPRNNTTIIDGGVTGVPVSVRATAAGAVVRGLVIRNGNDGLSARGALTLEANWFVGNGDHLDYNYDASGVIRDNIFEASTDDTLDMDHPLKDLLVADNLILNSSGDGVEMRLHDDTLPAPITVTFRGNQIVGSDNDGIEIIDYYTQTARTIVIERNLIRDNGQAAVGLMDNATTDEDYRGASITEHIRVFHNTMVRNHHGISGGDDLVALNNIFLGQVVGISKVDGQSIASHNLFWNNGTDVVASNVDSSISADPQLDSAYRPAATSPAVDAGVANYVWNGEVVMDQHAGDYQGAAPDLGWIETSSSGTTQNQPPVVNAGPDASVTLPDGATLDGSVSDDGLPDPPASVTTQWTQTAGPGVATFADPSAIDTTATFDSPGTYVLRLTADDGAATAFDEATLTVASDGGGGPVSIAFRGATTAAVVGKTAITLAAPAGLTPGDVEIAAILSVKSKVPTPPAGWAAIRTEPSGTSFRQTVYAHVATSAEPSSYTWTYAANTKVAGVLAAYAGVDVSAPVAASSGQVNASSASITAPSLSNPVAGAQLVGLFGVLTGTHTSITPPTGMTERGEVTTVKGAIRPALELSDASLPSTGATGTRTASSLVAGGNAGQLIALRPAGS
jgi:hypothetical protein